VIVVAAKEDVLVVRGPLKKILRSRDRLALKPECQLFRIGVLAVERNG
jgi:hypothetical protein